MIIGSKYLFSVSLAPHQQTSKPYWTVCSWNYRCHFILKWITGCYLAQHLPTRGPAAALTQAVDEPEEWEHGNGGGPGEGYVDAPHQEQADGEKPAGADLIRQHATDKLTDGIGHGLTAGDQTCRGITKVTITQCREGDNNILQK